MRISATSPIDKWRSDIRVAPELVDLNAELRSWLESDTPRAAKAEVAVSVIVPSFNSARFIERTIRSVAYQRSPAVELIVVDGGSTDGTLEIIEANRSLIDTVIVEPDRGQADAINKGFRVARGKWLCFLGADDLLLPGSLAAIQRAAADCPAAEIVFGDLLHIDANDCVTDFQLVLPMARLAFQFSAMQFHNQAAFLRRSLVERVGELDITLHFCLDYEFFVRIVKAQPVFVKVPRFVGAQRVHAGTKTSNLQSVHDREKREVQDRHFRRASSIWRLVSPVALRLARLCYFLLRGQYWYLTRHRHRRPETAAQ